MPKKTINWRQCIDFLPGSIQACKSVRGGVKEDNKERIIQWFVVNSKPGIFDPESVQFVHETGAAGHRVTRGYVTFPTNDWRC